MREEKRVKRLRQSGVTALFIVIFASILLSIITVSFTTMMVREQQRSTDDEQSQSAYDAAMAGVEDGKRVMAACLANPGGSACTAIANQRCMTVRDAGIQTAEPNGEVMLQSTTGDGLELNQAYTCVVISRDTSDYLAQLRRDESLIVPLRGAATFDRVIISWHTSEDASSSQPAGSVALPRLADWSTGRPALLRAQLIQFGAGAITPAGFDAAPNHTLYLHPQVVGGGLSFGLDSRRTPPNVPEGVRCEMTFPLSGYACTTTVTLPAAANRVSYLRLSSLYAGAHVRIELRNNATAVNFSNVQPRIDSTGRANDLFRRVEARVEMTNPDFPYPRATVDITNNFCKTFSVSSDAAGYTAGDCDPTRAGN